MLKKSKSKKIAQPLLNIEKRVDNSITFIAGDTLLNQQVELINNLKEIKKHLVELKENLKLKG